jgi:hypothetical protein
VVKDRTQIYADGAWSFSCWKVPHPEGAVSVPKIEADAYTAAPRLPSLDIIQHVEHFGQARVHAVHVPVDVARDDGLELKEELVQFDSLAVPWIKLPHSQVSLEKGVLSVGQYPLSLHRWHKVGCRVADQRPFKVQDAGQPAVLLKDVFVVIVTVYERALRNL